VCSSTIWRPGNIKAGENKGRIVVDLPVGTRLRVTGTLTIGAVGPQGGHVYIQPWDTTGNSWRWWEVNSIKYFYVPANTTIPIGPDSPTSARTAARSWRWADWRLTLSLPTFFWRW
jgi:hypothetical protein